MKPDYGIQYLAPGDASAGGLLSLRPKCSLFVQEILNAAPGSALATSLFSPWSRDTAGIGLPCEAHRVLPWVRGSGCLRRNHHSALAAIPSWALRGEKPRSSRSRPGLTGITPPGFSAVETLEKPDNAFSIRPRQAHRKGLGTVPPKSFATNRQELTKMPADPATGAAGPPRHLPPRSGG